MYMRLCAAVAVMKRKAKYVVRAVAKGSHRAQRVYMPLEKQISWQ